MEIQVSLSLPCSPLAPFLNRKNPMNLGPYLFKILFNIILYVSKSSLPFKFTDCKFSYIYIAPIHATRPAHLIFLSFIILRIFPEKCKFWNPLIMCFTSSSCHFSPLLGSGTPLSTLFPVCFSLDVRDQVSHPYEAAREMNWMAADSLEISSALKFLMNVILLCPCSSKSEEMEYSKGKVHELAT
jgi:hypothetical protein